MPEMDLRQHRFTYSACELFTINKEKILKKWKKQEVDNIFIKMN